jgi:hypothetical protein
VRPGQAPWQRVAFAFVAVSLAACGGAGQPTAAPAAATPPLATVTPTAGLSVPSTPSLAPTVVPTTAPATAPPGLTGDLLYARFVEATHTTTGMFTSSADGSGELAIPMPWTEGGGRWSTAGQLIAVPTEVNGRVGTAILDRAGNVVRVLELPDPTINLACTLWAPDDARLACESWDDTDATRAGIYTVRSSDGGDLKRVTTPPDGTADLPGDWGTDALIVFKRNSGDETDGPLHVVAAVGGEAKPLTSEAYEDPGRFSPDGNLVATSSGGIVRIIDAKGAIVSTIEVPNSYLFGPAWSPDGKWLVFSLATTGPFADLYISRPDGSDRYQVTRTPTNEIAVDW